MTVAPLAAPVYRDAAHLSAFPGPFSNQRYAIVESIGLFKWYASDVTAADSTTVIAPSGGSVGRWKLSAAFPGAPTWLPGVDVVATSDLTLSGLQTVDGVSLTAGMTVLPSAQANLAQRVPMVAASGAWTRPTWFDTTAEAVVGSIIPVRRGTTYGGTIWRMSSPTSGSITLGTTEVQWTQYKADLSSATPSDVGAAASGVSTLAARADHVHGHGSQGGGSQHSSATTSVAGFLSAADKTNIDLYGLLLLANNAARIVTATGVAATDTAALQSVVSAGLIGLLVGDFVVSAPISGRVRFISLFPGLASIATDAGWSGTADDPTNSVLLCRSTMSGADAGTISAQINRGEASMSSAAALSNGSYYRILSTSSQTGLAGYSAGSAVTHYEIVRLTSGSSPYSLDRSCGQSHGSGSAVRLVSSLISDVLVRGVRFSLGSAAANALYCECVVGGEVDCEVTGGSRAGVELDGCRDFKINVLGRGGCNSEVYGRSLVGSTVTVRTLETGDRYHASGTPRGAVFFDRMCAGVVVKDCDIKNRVRGLARRGGVELVYRNCVVSDCDVARYIAQDSANAIQISTSRAGGAGIDAGNTQTGNSLQESGFANVYENITLRNCGSSATGANDAHSGAGLFVNETGLFLSSIVVENTGRNPQSSPYLNGLVFWDFYNSRISGLVFKGIENAITLLGGWDRVDFGDENYWDGASSAGTAQIFLRYGLNGDEASQPIDVQLGKWTFADTPTFAVANLNGITPTDFGRRKLRFRRMVIQNRGAWDDIEWVRDVSGTSWNWGEVAELRAPVTFTALAADDTFTSAAHGFPDGAAVYVRANAGGTLPTGVVAGTVYYVRDAAANTFKLAATSGGAAINLTADSAGSCAVQAVFGVITTPTDDATNNKVVVINGTGFGSGPLPAGWYLVAHGPEVTARVADADIALRGDRVEAVSGARTLRVDASAAAVFGTVCGNKATGAAGRVRIRRAA